MRQDELTSAGVGWRVMHPTPNSLTFQLLVQGKGDLDEPKSLLRSFIHAAAIMRMKVQHMMQRDFQDGDWIRESHRSRDVLPCLNVNQIHVEHVLAYQVSR